MRKATRRFSLVVALIMVLGLLSAFPAMVSAVLTNEYYLEVDNANPAVGDTVTLTASIRNLDATSMVDGVVAVTLPVLWDTSILTFVGNEATTLPAQWADVTNKTQAANGRVSINLMDDSDAGDPHLEDNFFVYELTFTVIAEGTVNFRVEGEETVDNEFEVIAMNITTTSLTVGGGEEPGPEPSTKTNEYYLEVDNANPAVGDTVTLTASIRNLDATSMVDGVVAVTLPVLWDTSILTFVGNEATTLPAQWADVTNKTQAANGRVSINLMDDSDAGDPHLEDNFFVYELTFTVIAEGTVDFRVEGEETVDNEFEVIAMNITTTSLTVGGGDVPGPGPEPSTKTNEYYLEVDNANPAVGDTVTLTASIRNLDATSMVDGVVAVTLPVLWDTSILTFVGNEATTLPAQWADVTNKTQAANGRVSINLMDDSDAGDPHLEDNFFVYELTFTAIAEGTVDFRVEGEETVDNEFEVIAMNITTTSLTVGGGDVPGPGPEPSTKTNEYYLEVDNANPAVGDTVTLTASIRNLDAASMVDGVVAVTLPVLWDTSILTFVGNEATTLPAQWADVTNKTQAANGRVSINLMDDSDAGDPHLEDNFFVYELTFTAIAEGTVDFRVEGEETVDNEFEVIAMNITTTSLTVSGGEEPEPDVYYNVTFVAGANGTLSGTTTVSVLEGTDLSAVTFPTATANPGYKFVAWDKTSGAINAPTTVTASFEYDASQWFTVTYNLDGKGTTSDATSFGPFVTGTAWSAAGITVPVVTGTGVYSFIGWDKVAPATITADVVFTAQYQAAEGTKYITFKAGANGTILGYDDSNNLVANEIKRSLTAGEKVGAALATPAAIGNENYHFIGWYTDAGELYDFNSVVVDDVTLTAKFALNEFTVSEATVNGSDYVYTVTFNDGAAIDDAALSNAKMYVFQQNTNGTTSASPVSNLKAVVIDNTITVTVASGSSVASIDLYFAYDTIDWASNDWNIIDIVIG